MPVPRLPIKKDESTDEKPRKLKPNSGPSPKCECGKCKVCKNRIHQRLFYERNRERILQDKHRKYQEGI